MKKIFIVILLLPLALSAQKNGINFEETLSWREVLAKAQKENKYIFLDCYTTWCGPCKAMEKTVYTQDSVGDYMNTKFISVKVQLDRTAQDNNHTRRWYSDAEKIANQYNVMVYPTYLFFAPDGSITDKQTGLKTGDQFINMAALSLVPGKKYTDPYAEYYRLLSAYHHKKKNYLKMPYLVKTAKELQHTKLADSLTADYRKYLLCLNKKALYRKEIIEFLASDVQGSKDAFFSLFYPDGRRADSLMGRTGYSQEITDRILAKEEVKPLVNSTPENTEPDWNKLQANIQTKYDQHQAERAVLMAQTNWYLKNKDLKAYIKHFIQQVEKYGTDTTNGLVDAALNNFACCVLVESNDSTELNIVIGWMQGVIRRNYCVPIGNIWDTYANLLYKVGRKEEALKWEEKALHNISGSAFAPLFENTFQKTLEKMRKGEPTW